MLTKRYVLENYCYALPLKRLDNYNPFIDYVIDDTKEINYNSNDKDKDEMEQFFFAYILTDKFMYDELIETIGEFIRLVYIKEQTTQPLWCVNYSRLLFIINHPQQHSTQPIWIKDINGEYIISEIIQPLINFVNDFIVKYTRKILCLSVCTNTQRRLVDKCFKTQEFLMKTTTLTNILKTIAPYFTMSRREI